MVQETEIATVEFSESATADTFAALLDDTIDEKPWFRTESNEDGTYTVYERNSEE